VAVFVAIGSLTWPAGRDQSVFQWVGETILDGGAPYRDAWDQKGPLLYYIWALALGVSGRHEAAVRVLDLGLLLAGCVLLHRFTRRLSGEERFGADFAVIFLVLAYFGGGFSNTAQPDAWGGLLILATVVLLLRRERGRVAALACGASIALATLLKPTFLIYLALPVLHELVTTERRDGRWTRLAIYLLAFVAVVLAALLALAALSGGLADYVDVLRFTFLNYATNNRHPLRELVLLPFDLLAIGLLVPCLLAPFGLWRLHRAGLTSEARLLGAWWLLAVFTVLVQGKYWIYHWAPVSIALAPLLGVALGPCGRRLTLWRDGSPITLALALLLSISVVAPAATRAVFHSYAWPRYMVGLESKEQYAAHFTTPDGWWRIPIFMQLADYIAPRSQPTDTLLVWGWEVQINLLARRKPPTRFGFSFPLTVPGPMQVPYRRQFLADISRAPPRYVVVCVTCPTALSLRTGLEEMDDFVEFKQWLHERYDPIREVGAFELWGLSGARGEADALSSSIASTPE